MPELGDPVAARALRLVQGDVGVAQQVPRGLTVAGGDADRRGDRDRVAGAEVERLAQHGQDPLGDQIRATDDEHDEFVAAEPADRVRLAQDALDPRRDHPQQLVADGMAERVVDALEAVEVDEHRRRVDPVAAGVDEHLLGAIHDQRAVGETGQRVVQRLVAELAGLLLDHPQRAGAAAGQHLHEQEREQPERDPDHENEERLDFGVRQAGRLGAGDGDGPAAVGFDRDPLGQAIRARDRAVAGRGRRLHRLRERAERRRRHGSRAGRQCSRSSVTATSVWRPTDERRIGSASNSPTIQPVASARRSPTVRGHAAAAVDRGDDLEHLVAVAGVDHERAELARVASVAQQPAAAAQVEPGDGQLRRACRPCRGRPRSSFAQAVIGALAARVDVARRLARDLDVAEAGHAAEALVDAHRAIPARELRPRSSPARSRAACARPA